LNLLTAGLKPIFEIIKIALDRVRAMLAANEIGGQANGATRLEIAEYQKALNSLDVQQDRLVKLLTEDFLSKDDYHRQNERVKQGGRHFTAKLKQTQLRINESWRYPAQIVGTRYQHEISMGKWNTGEKGRVSEKGVLELDNGRRKVAIRLEEAVRNPLQYADK